MNVYQWPGYPPLTYEVPIDGSDGRIPLVRSPPYHHPVRSSETNTTPSRHSGPL